MHLALRHPMRGAQGACTPTRWCLAEAHTMLSEPRSEYCSEGLVWPGCSQPFAPLACMQSVACSLWQMQLTQPPHHAGTLKA